MMAALSGIGPRPLFSELLRPEVRYLHIYAQRMKHVAGARSSYYVSDLPLPSDGG
jgi:hypothetical protein